MLPLVSLVFDASVAWISWTIVYFQIDLDLHKMLYFLRKFFFLFLPLSIIRHYYIFLIKYYR